MLDALRIIVKNGAIVLFIVLQIFCFYWIVKYNQRQNQIYFYSSQVYSNYIYEKYGSVISYFNLAEVNDSLIQENKFLLSKTFNQSKIYSTDSSVYKNIPQGYDIISANVVNNSLARRNNMLTLNKGSKDGINSGMGVITAYGLVGIVTDVSEHFSLVLSMLHSKSRISCRIPKNGFIGSLVWDGKDPMILNLEEIQRYAEISVGDSIVTSGYSIVFPENILLGKIKSFSVEPGAFTYTILVEPTQSFFTVDNVYVINHPFKSEKESLENQFVKYE